MGNKGENTMKIIQLRFMLIVLSGLYDLMLKSNIHHGPYEEIMKLKTTIKKELEE